MYAVIMAGGRGARFWPRSREKKPKHLLDIISKRTIIQETVDRIKPLIAPENILVVTGRKHARTLITQLPEIPAANIIIEPQGKNTAACIGLAALHIRKKACDAVMVVLPSDHAIGDAATFIKVLAAAAAAAVDGDKLLTIGIKPTSPHTGFGYLEEGLAAQQAKGVDIFKINSILEKPNAEKAQVLLQSGNYFWNSGMFIWKASTILQAISQWLPDLNQGLLKIQEHLGTAKEGATVRQVYQKLASISVDYGIMEKAHNVFMLKGDFGWSDVGSWDALWEISAKDNQGNAFISDSTVLAKDSVGSLVYSPQKLVALVGVQNLIVVETKDALLICQKGKSQDVKNIVDTLEEKKLKKYL